MSYDIYKELINQLCKKFNMPDATSKDAAFGLQLNKVNFTLQHGGEADPDGLCVLCDFGEPPAGQLALVLERLLASNLFMYGNDMPNFGINPVTGHVILMHRLPILQINLAVLLSVMSQATVQARAWRTAFLLDETEQLATAT